jgi:hypothetical protein
MGAAGAGAGGGGESRGELGGEAAGQLLEWLIRSASCNKRKVEIDCLETLTKTLNFLNLNGNYMYQSLCILYLLLLYGSHCKQRILP